MHEGLRKKFPQVFRENERSGNTSFFTGREVTIAQFKEHLINTQIRAYELRVISETGEQLGVMGYSQAMKLAEDAGLDLVLISPTAKPPVAKIVDYGKYKFETIRKEKEARRAQKIVKTKEVQLSLGIQENEVAFKLGHARRFLEDGNKVKVCINRIRGRQTMNADKGVATLNNFATSLEDIADVEQPPTKSGVPGRNINIVMIIAPTKSKKEGLPNAKNANQQSSPKKV